MITFNVRDNIRFSDLIYSYKHKLLQPFSDFKSYRSAYKNYIHVLRKKISNRYPIDVILNNGLHFKISNLSELRISKWCGENQFKFQEEILTINKKNLPEIKLVDWQDNGDVRGVFFDNEYDFLPVKNKIVIDIGANIADTSIYFSQLGAKKIIALEPAPKNFESAKKNIHLNGLEKKVELVLAGCSSKKGNIQISAEKSGVVYSLEDEEIKKVEVPLLRLEDLIKQNLSSSLILKMDCEGCEYESILNTECEILKKFSHIQIEYHFGYKNLMKKLEKCGFDVNVTRPQIGERLYQGKQKAFFGYIFATRKEKKMDN